jgi:predicted chitinase
MRAKEFITERKKKRKKPRWAAYGPGPYGLYGWDAGYSGAGGVSSGDGGGVGEASYPGNLGAMELVKFFQKAGPEEKKILQQLINKKDYKRAWAMIQGLTGVKLQGHEFESIDEGWKEKLAALGIAGTLGLSSASGAEPKTTSMQDKIIATVVIDGETKRLDLTPKGFDDVRDAEKWLDKFMRDRGIMNWQGKIEKGQPGSGQYQRVRIMGAGGLESINNEGWRDTLTGLALGAGVVMSNPAAANVEKVQVGQGDTVYSIAKTFGTTPQAIQKLNKLDKNFSVKAGQTLKIPSGEVIDVIKNPSKEKKAEPVKKKPAKIDTSKTLTGTTHEAVLTRTARASGITDPTELAAFLAQCAHESHDFKSMVEYGGSLDFRKYDPKFAPKKARALGNTKVGDGARYKGRGYIQLTGRYNYKRAGEALGLPLEQNPELAEKPEVAAKIAVWFWKQRVQPNVDNFNDVRAVTKPINPGLNGLENRKEAFIDFKKFKLAMR